MAARRVLAGVAVLVLVVSAGCLGQFGTGVSEEELAEDAEYEWNTTAETELRLDEGGFLDRASYQAVYSGNETVLRLSTRGLTRTHSVDVRSVQYRYAENGSVVGHEHVDVRQTARETTIRLPEEDGQFAFTGDRRSQEVHFRTVDDGNVTVVLPPDHEVGDLLLSDVQPRNYETEPADGDRVALRWEEVDDDTLVLVRHYLERDWYLFYGLLGVLTVAAAVVYAHFQREIRKVQRKREEYGLDVDYEDDGDPPPPGVG